MLYLAGADPHEGDRLGRLALSYDGLEARDRRVFDLGLAAAGAAGVFHGGWIWANDIATTVQAQLNTWRVAL